MPQIQFEPIEDKKKIDFQSIDFEPIDLKPLDFEPIEEPIKKEVEVKKEEPSRPGFWNRSTGFIKNIAEEVAKTGKESSDLIMQGKLMEGFGRVAEPTLAPFKSVAELLQNPKPTQTEAVHSGLSMLGIPAKEISEDWQNKNWPGLAGDITGTVLPILAMHKLGKTFNKSGLNKIGTEITSKETLAKPIQTPIDKVLSESKPSILDKSGREIAPAQTVIPNRPNGPWNNNGITLGEKPRAEPIGSFSGFEGDAGPQYNIIGGPEHGRTVGVDTLKRLGIEVPKAELSPEGSMLRDGINRSKPLNKKQAEIYTTERAQRFAAAGKIDITDEASANAFMGKLAGQHTKVEIEPLQFDQTQLNNLYKTIGTHLKANPEIDITKAAQAKDAITKLMRGEVPQPSQLDTLETIFGKGVTDNLRKGEGVKTSWPREIWDLSRSMMTVDAPYITSAAFRQGFAYVGTKDWMKALLSSVKSFGSKDTFEGVMNKINADPLFKRTLDPSTSKFIPSYADRIGIRIDDLATKRPEMIRGQLAERIPIYGKYVAANNRAFTAFQNQLRASRTISFFKTAESNYNIAKLTGKQGLLGINSLAKTPFSFKIDNPELLNPKTNIVLGKQIAESINTLTGGGTLGVEVGNHQVNVEKASKFLTDVLFAPRLYASKVRMLNPSTYITSSPIVRQEYLKGMLRSISAWWGVAELAELNGAEVSKDPNSSDFGKIKIGNTRIDPGAGNQQWLVFYHRMLPRSMGGGGITNSNTGEFQPFGEGFKPETRWSTATNFATNKLNPNLKGIVDLAAASENRPVYLRDRIIQQYVPMLSGDMTQVIKENPELAPFVYIFGSAGMGTQTYEAGPSKPVFTNPESDVRIGGTKTFKFPIR